MTHRVEWEPVTRGEGIVRIEESTAEGAILVFNSVFTREVLKRIKETVKIGGGDVPSDMWGEYAELVGSSAPEGTQLRLTIGKNMVMLESTSKLSYRTPNLSQIEARRLLSSVGESWEQGPLNLKKWLEAISQTMEENGGEQASALREILEMVISQLEKEEGERDFSGAIGEILNNQEKFN